MELLTIEEMATADAMAVQAGQPVIGLMKRAGKAVADHAASLLESRSQVIVVCGPGNNGGDGFVAAKRLHDLGHNVEVVLLGSMSDLSEAAADAAFAWSGKIRNEVTDLSGDLIIDALFGAGLTRVLEGDAAKLVDAINRSGAQVVAVDVPSGLSADTGMVEGPIVRADSTVTFFRKKPGHLLFPGRSFCGEVILAEIGIPDEVLASIGPTIFENGPDVWGEAFPHPVGEGHKYSRGHAVVVSGPLRSTGAARLAARGALRIGAGLVTVATPGSALATHAAHLTAVMIETFETTFGLEKIMADERKNALVIGPGFGVGPNTTEAVIAMLKTNAAVVLDADALTSFAGNAAVLMESIADRSAKTVLTPHEGEFSRLFDVQGPKVDRARAAAEMSGGVVVIKGADTVVADPGGKVMINANAPAWLATAGAGDVLAGFAAGLMAQGMPAFEAASAAVWLHGAAAAEFGPGLIAEDLPEALPTVLAKPSPK